MIEAGADADLIEEVKNMIAMIARTKHDEYSYEGIKIVDIAR